MKPDFEKAQNTATMLLLQQNVNSLYIDVRNFNLPAFITIDTMQNYAMLTGFPLCMLRESQVDGSCVIKTGGRCIILYDDAVQNEQRKHWGIAHELGHIFLGHEDDSEKSEKEAHFFAAQIVAPEIVLMELCRRRGRLNDAEIYWYFNLSHEAAEKRLTTLLRRSTFNFADIDKQLLIKFIPLLARAA